jgi:hypothetical protein
MVSSCWFVDKAYTTGVMIGEGEAKKLRMEIGLRHEDLRASASFTYSNGVGGSKYALEEVLVGRQQMDEFPDPSQPILFGPLLGVVDASAQLSGECVYMYVYSLSLSRTHTHTNTHTHMCVYVYIYIVG